MTKLRDDGYLETDDAVVAACFLGRNARFIFFDTKEISDGLYAVLTIRQDGWNNHDYPIFIPAKTVAEVCDKQAVNPVPLVVLVTATGGRSDAPMKLFAWLRTHTKEGE